MAVHYAYLLSLYHHGMSRLQVAYGGDGLQISSIAVHIPNIYGHGQTTVGGPPVLLLGGELTMKNL